MLFWFPAKHLNQYQYAGPELSIAGDFFKNFNFRELNEEDFYKNIVFEEKDRKNRYLNHIKKGHRCFAFVDSKGMTAAYFWLTIGRENQYHPVPIFKQSGWLLSPDEAYLWDCRTLANYRRQGLYKAGLQRLVALCQQQHIKKIMMSCDISNAISNAGIISAGFKFCGTVHFRAIGKLKTIRCYKRRFKIMPMTSPVITIDVFPTV